MENKKIDLSVIVPITNLEGINEDFFKTAIGSVKNLTVKPLEVIYIVNDEKLLNVIDSLEKDVYGDEVLIPSKKITLDSTIFCDLVNKAVDSVDSKYFSVLELNSSYLPNYFQRVLEFMESTEYSDVKMFLPTTGLASEEGVVLQFINEAVWAQGFSTTLGKLDFNTLWENNIFVLGGSVISKEAFEEVGKFKSDIKLYFAYEFLLRFVNNDHAIVSIPRLSYKHVVGKDAKGSLYNLYKDAIVGITQDEAKFFLDSAKQEYLFNPNEFEREIKYSSDVAD